MHNNIMQDLLRIYCIVILTSCKTIVIKKTFAFGGRLDSYATGYWIYIYLLTRPSEELRLSSNSLYKDEKHKNAIRAEILIRCATKSWALLIVSLLTINLPFRIFRASPIADVSI